MKTEIKRIQRKRTKGYKLPPNTVCINRPLKWGNPLKLVGDMIYVDAGYRRKTFDKWVYLKRGDINDLLYLYSRLLKYNLSFAERRNKDLVYWSERFLELDTEELRGKNLACFCATDKPCHGDILLKHANRK